MPFSRWEDPESRLRLRTRPFEKDALLLRCSDAEVGQDRASGVDRPSTVRVSPARTDRRSLIPIRQIQVYEVTSGVFSQAKYSQNC